MDSPGHCHELPDKYLIPIKMGRDILTLLHDSHPGTVRTKERTRLIVYRDLHTAIQHLEANHPCLTRMSGTPLRQKDPLRALVRQGVEVLCPIGIMYGQSEKQSTNMR